MKDQQDYIRDIAEMRSMMERSSKFLSLSGLAGVLAGVYALLGAFLAYRFLGYRPGSTASEVPGNSSSPDQLLKLVLLAVGVLVLAVGTAFFLSHRKAQKRGEKTWNATTRRLLTHMAVPLVTGGLLILILLAKGQPGFLAPFSLVFYGLALFNASKFTYEEVKSLGLIEVSLGLFSAWFTEYGLLCWATGFGVVHIVYGIYMHYRYER